MPTPFAPSAEEALSHVLSTHARLRARSTMCWAHVRRVATERLITVATNRTPDSAEPGARHSWANQLSLRK